MVLQSVVQEAEKIWAGVPLDDDVTAVVLRWNGTS
jgi:hypothetical protein